MITFTAEGKLEGDRALVSVKDTELKIGFIGSDDPTPEELLLGAALSCMLLTIHYIARERRVSFDEISGYIEGELDPKGFQGDPSIRPGVLKVKYDIVVVSKDERMGEVLELSLRRCPLKDTLMRGTEVDVKWEIRRV
ncbi:OsmC family protein [Metallosphaera tengchongensis]|uniref:OsmC family protein n=1 Tax=Metallosphaera tengchongensis TaxID=1532350 RepID=A0A6N0NUJ7_9CREN|nr:OsmC family protein [Metallosphaera tengchongensis]QKQ99157.1 OsmC family protein [Metallosphaera tengchongensis]